MLSRSTFSEGVHHLALLHLFLLLQQTLPALTGGAGVTAATDTLWLNLTLLPLILCACAGRPGRLLMRGIAALLYLLIVSELRFLQETGAYFSATLAAHALAHWTDAAQVVVPTAADNDLLATLLLALIFWLMPVLMRRSRRSLALTVAIIALTSLMALWTQLSAGSQPMSLFRGFFMPTAHLTGGGRVSYDYRPPDHRAGLTPGPGAPDILLVVLESTRADKVPGFSRQTTGGTAHMPALSTLAATGVRFREAYTTASHTSKALVGLLCGYHPHPAMVIRSADPDTLPGPCLPRLLAGAGYRTLFLSSATGRFEQRRQLAGNLGFDTIMTREDLDPRFQRVGYFGMDESAMVAPLTRWWRQTDTRPRLAVLLTSVTHHPYAVPGRPLPADAEAGYMAGLTHTDAMLGEVLAALGHNLDRSLIVVTGDHGEGFGEHGRYQHDNTPYQEGVRIPLLLVDRRGGLPARSDDGLRQHIDVLPTLLRLAGLRADGRWPGLDLLDSQGHDEIITRCWHMDACLGLIRKNGDKWIQLPGEGLMARYQLRSDPDERRNLAGLAPQADEAASQTLLLHRMALQQLWEPR